MKLFGRPLETLEIVLIAGLAGVAGSLTGPHLSALWQTPRVAEVAVDEPSLATQLPTTLVPEVAQKENLVQVALILDVSGSMSGLIAQARSQLWRTVNQVAELKRHGRGVKLELALYAYGMGDHAEDGYLALLQPFTSDLDAIGQELFALETSGSDEFAGQVLRHALTNLRWSDDPEALKLVYLAGNESIQQGPVDIFQALAQAKDQNVNVNVVFCGHDGESDIVGWRQSAARAGTTLASINHNADVREQESPYDQEIAQIGAAINETYVGRGAQGAANVARQKKLDALSAADGSNVKRQLAKSSKLYRADWDLVQLAKEKPEALAAVAEEDVPAEFKGLGASGLKAALESKATARAELQHKLGELNRKREEHLSTQAVPANAAAGSGLDGALDESLAQSAAAVGYQRK